MRHTIITKLTGVALVAAGMYGLASGIEYSGWVLAVGLLVACS